MAEEDKTSAGAAIQLLNQAALGYIVSAALNVALELGIADRLADGPRSTADLARDSGAHEDSLYRVLRALASAGIFEERGPRTFALNLPASMLKKGQASLHDLGLWMTDPFHFRVYAEMLHSARTGQPAAEKVTGMPVFEYFAKEPTLSSVFNNAMTSWSGPTVAAALKAYDFTGIGTLIDVAGGKVDATARLEGVAEAAQIARFSPDNKVLAVTSLKSNTVSLIDPSFRQQVAVKVGDQPMDMAFRGNELFVACQGDGSVHVVDITQRRNKRHFKAGKGCESVGFF